NVDIQTMYFAVHRDAETNDNTWLGPEVVYGGPGTWGADDHINLKSVSDGRVLAATKTSKGDQEANMPSSSPQILFNVRTVDGVWHPYEFGKVRDNHTRPIVVVDTTNGCVHMFATWTSYRCGGTGTPCSTDTGECSPQS